MASEKKAKSTKKEYSQPDRRKLPHVMAQPTDPTVYAHNRKPYLTFNTIDKYKYGLKLRPVSEEWLKQWAEDFLQWAKESEYNLCYEQWYALTEVTKPTVFAWRKKYDFLKETFLKVDQIFAARRKIGLMTGDYTHHAGRDLFRYDPEWIMVEQHHAQIQAEAQQTIAGVSTTPIQVSVPLIETKPEIAQKLFTKSNDEKT